MNQTRESQTQQSEIADQESANRVVILGSGYAGIHACRTLLRQSDEQDDLEIVLLSDVDHMLYVTMIYEVPAGNLAPSSIRQSVRTMVDGNDVTFRQGTATTVDTENQTVLYEPKNSRPETTEETQQLTLSYDYLVSAIGSETEYFGTPGAEEHTYKLKKLNQAKQLKNTLINNFERAVLETDEKKIEKLLTFVVVGGGPTGVTLAAKLSDLLNHELARAFPNLIDHAKIYILEANDRMVERAGPWFANNITHTLKQIPRLQTKTTCKVEEVRPDGVVVVVRRGSVVGAVVVIAGVVAAANQREVDVRVGVDGAVVFVGVSVADPPEPPGREGGSEQPQEDRHPDRADGIEDRRERCPLEEEVADAEPPDHERDVAEAETHAHERGQPRVAESAGQRRDAGDVIRLDGVGHTQETCGGQRADEGRGHGCARVVGTRAVVCRRTPNLYCETRGSIRRRFIPVSQTSSLLCKYCVFGGFLFTTPTSCRVCLTKHRV
jgi:NADH dehydrogenase FAD-containing subunit